MNILRQSTTALLFSFLIVTNAYAFTSSNIFEKYIGCYSTIKFNGAPVVQAPYYVESEFRKSNDSHLQDSDTRENLPSIDMAIFQGYNPEDNSFNVQFQPVLTNRGRTFSDEKGDHFEFSGKLFHVGLDDTFETQMTTDVLALNDSQIEVTLFYKLIELDLELNFSYVLERKACISVEPKVRGNIQH